MSNQGQHGLGDGRRPNADAGIVPPFGGDLDGFARRLTERRGWAIDEVGLMAILTTISCPSKCRPGCRRRGWIQSRPVSFRRRAPNLLRHRGKTRADFDPFTALMPIMA